VQREREDKIDLVQSDQIVKGLPPEPAASNTDLPNFGDRYETIELIGQGGMGSVYKVKDRQLGTFFAIKLLKPELAKDKTSVKRFEKEAEATSKLTHENLVTVYEHGCTGDGTPFIVMEFIGDQNLGQFIEERSHLEPAEAIEVFKQICDALSYAHKSGVIHRDLKPSNIVVSKLSQPKKESPNENGTNKSRPPDLEIKVTDFGIASVAIEGAAAGETLTKTGDIIGSPLYMSPEQCQGQSLDKRSDIYSLGCVMYTILTGHAPFDGGNPVQIILKQIQETAPPLKIRTGINKELEKIIQKCLEKQKRFRYDSVEDVKADLLRVSNGKTINYVSAQSRAKYQFVANAVLLTTTIITICALGSSKPTTKNQAATAPSIVQRPASLTIDQALKHFKARQYDEAIPLLQYVAATAKREGNRQFEAFLYQCIGQSYLALKQYSDAELWYEKSIKLTAEFRQESMETLQKNGAITEATTGYIESLRALNKHEEALRLLKSMNIEKLRDLETFYENNFPPEDLKRVHDLRIQRQKLN
jgi:serine/threonine protein kinase